MNKKRNGKHFKEIHRKNKTKLNKKNIIQFYYWAFIICCLVISILCLFKHKEEVDRVQGIKPTYPYMTQEEQQSLINDIKSGKLKVSQDVPIPQELQDKMKKEAEKKAKEEEQKQKIAEQKAKEEQKKKEEAERKAKAEEQKRKEEQIKMAQSKKVTSRGTDTSRKTNTNTKTKSSTKKSSGTKAEYQAYAKDLCINKYGWTESDFNCLVKLWNRESGWRANAHNSSSGAHGIPQSLPANKMASEGSDYYTNGKTQIRWGLKYIKGRYGNPTKAWNHSQRTGWY